MEGTLDQQGRRRWWWGAGVVLLCVGVVLGVLVQRATWAGPALANGLRRVMGDRAVTWLEERVAGVQDRVLRVTRGHAPPRELVQDTPVPQPPPAPVVTESPASRARVAAQMDAGTARQLPALEAVVPPFPSVAAPHDGQWFPVADPERPEAPALLHRTLLHPDPERSYAELFVVRMPTSETAVRVVAGAEEAESENPDAVRLAARGLIAPEDEAGLLAAFNGGFRARHGRHGMIVEGVTLLPLREGLCTISGGPGLELRILSWQRAAPVEAGRWYRQTPPCMLDAGVLHPGLANPESRKWGATLEGETVIRRSAIALDREARTLYVGVSNYTTARALALGMQSAGGWVVAQLDVNWSYPKILTFPRDEGGVRHAVSLFRGFLFEPDEMLRRPAARDFFYVIRR